MQQQNDQQALESAILTTISSMDKPSSPAQEAISACHAALHGRTEATRQRLRQQMLNVTLDDLKRIVQNYLHADVVQKSVVASMAKEELVKQLGFDTYKVV